MTDAVLLSGEFERDAAACAAAWRAADDGDDLRAAFLDRHAEALYRRLTGDYRKFVRVEQLVLDAARLVPGLVPSESELAAERTRKLSEKRGLERRQGLLLGKIAAVPQAGLHLIHAMLLPRPESAEALAKFRRDGRLDLGRVRMARRGAATEIVMSQPDRLNCEDDTTYPMQEIAADVVLMDPDTQVGILRGDVVAHPKYAGRRLFSSGINLTGLYWGQVSFMFYIARDMGFVNKMHRGIAPADCASAELDGYTTEKLWIAAVEGFAIGGGCQLLLVVDHVIAEQDAFLSLPARKEGIIPGMANLRLPRIVGERLARQAILNDRRIPCDSPEGRLLCDDVVARGEVDTAIDRAVDGLTGSGVVSAAGNRKALRIGAEPLDTFRRYLALYAREQADCHFSPALIANLERNWQAHQRKTG